MNNDFEATEAICLRKCTTVPCYSLGLTTNLFPLVLTFSFTTSYALVKMLTAVLTFEPDDIAASEKRSDAALQLVLLWK